eukprot:scaffold16914_cov53-Phaeocystis_antarctica.AAC.6
MPRDRATPRRHSKYRDGAVPGGGGGGAPTLNASEAGASEAGASEVTMRTLRRLTVPSVSTAIVSG